MTTSLSHAAGIARKFVFKNAEMYRYAAKLLEVALAKPLHEPWFAADEVPETYYMDSHTPGCVVAALRDAHVFEACLVHQPERGINRGRRASIKPSRKSAWVDLWQLRDRDEALRLRREFGAASGCHSERSEESLSFPGQRELFSQPVEQPS
jgi:hypothetical protein